ncbi:unnamed protein product, partial [Timema podura]|nr:unnamed protein product [Timema podura]
NQETIVELLGFTQRVFPKIKSAAKKPPVSLDTSVTSPFMMDESLARTELTFDFHRLNVLLLRAVVKEGAVSGRKIGTAMLSEAKIQATLGKETVVQGSLGGLQVLDLTPEGQTHQRILSLGKDPLIDRSSLDLVHTDLYTMEHSSVHLEERQAFSFGIKRSASASVSGPGESHYDTVVIDS